MRDLDLRRRAVGRRGRRLVPGSPRRDDSIGSPSLPRSSPPVRSLLSSRHERSSVGVASLGINYTSQHAIVFSPWE
jgi:hypothetical protein